MSPLCKTCTWVAHGSAQIETRSVGRSSCLLGETLACRLQSAESMALSSLLRRMGFVKLDDFGLILTPEGRILSARSVVLDDGLGGKIVGWREDDLAAMELDKWEPALPPKKRPTVIRPPLPPAAVTIAPAAPPPVPRAKSPSLPGMPVAKSAPPPVIVKPVAAPVAEAPVVEEDEWEWEIAVARARAQAEWAAEAEAAAPRPSPIAIEPLRKRDPMQSDSWPQTEPLMDAWETNTNTTDRGVRVLPRQPSPTPPKPIVVPTLPLRAPAPTPVAASFAVGDQTSPTVQTSAAPRSLPSGTRSPVTSWTNVGTGTKAPWASRTADPWPAAKTTPNASYATGGSTVIPVPQMPVATDPRQVRPRTPTGSSSVMAPPRRIPRATPPQTTEDTVVNQIAAPANDDLTSPGLLLPAPASTTTKRVAAKQR